MATKYVIKSTTLVPQYISCSTTAKISLVDDINAATTWTSRDSATKVVKNNIPKSIRSNKADGSNVEFIVEEFNYMPDGIIPHCDSLENYSDIKEKLETITSYFKEFEKEKEQLKAEHSKIEKTLSDFYHNVEFTNVSSKVTKAELLAERQQLQDILKERRKIKDRTSILYSVMSCAENSGFIDSVKNSLKNVDAMDKRVYAKRVED